MTNRDRSLRYVIVVVAGLQSSNASAASYITLAENEQLEDAVFEALEEFEVDGVKLRDHCTIDCALGEEMKDGARDMIDPEGQIDNHLDDEDPTTDDIRKQMQELLR